MMQEKLLLPICKEDAIESYYQTINNEKLLTEKEETELIQRIGISDQTAFDQLVRSNLRQVAIVANEYLHKIAKKFIEEYKSAKSDEDKLKIDNKINKENFYLSEFINAGNAGLLKAVDKFDLHRPDANFRNYSLWWIRQEIMKSYQNIKD